MHERNAKKLLAQLQEATNDVRLFQHTGGAPCGTSALLDSMDKETELKHKVVAAMTGKRYRKKKPVVAKEAFNWFN